jgi:IMP dehydrogenase/GMP reductase
LGNSVNTDILSETNDFVDAIKVGIAQGFACETKNTAGCTEKQFSAVLKFKDLANKLGMPIISDGGIREPADFTKAIAAGASSVMAGKVFAECEESAGEIVSHNDSNKKLYAGMASSYVQESWKGGLKPGTCAEGGVRYLEISGSIKDMIEKYSGALRSGITYSGANDIKSFHNNVEFIELI